MKERTKPPVLHDHSPEGIADRLSEIGAGNTYLGDAVLGAVDGCVTTFAVVSGAAGAGFSAKVAIILGFSNLLADGLSMAVSNYQKTKSEEQEVAKARAIEEQHIEHFPEGEREEVRQIYEKKGFSGKLLQDVVNVITADRDRWVNTMLTEEWRLNIHAASPIKAALATFFAFLVVGCIPLLPYLILSARDSSDIFPLAVLSTMMTFFAIGFIKGRFLKQSALRSALETLLLGGAASLVAYLVGYLLRNFGAAA